MNCEEWNVYIKPVCTFIRDHSDDVNQFLQQHGTWASVHLLLPLALIPLSAFILYMMKEQVELNKLIREGQLLFYSTTILAASLYELTERGRAGNDKLFWPILLVAAFALFVQGGVIAGGSKAGVTRVLWASVFVAIAAAGLSVSVRVHIAAVGG